MLKSVLQLVLALMSAIVSQYSITKAISMSVTLILIPFYSNTQP